VKSLEDDIRFFKSLQPSLSIALRTVRGRFDDDFRVAAVDGSCTPAPAVKVGVGVSVITAGYMIYEGKEIVEFVPVSPQPRMVLLDAAGIQAGGRRDIRDNEEACRVGEDNWSHKTEHAASDRGIRHLQGENSARPIHGL